MTSPDTFRPLPSANSPIHFSDLEDKVIIVTGASSGIGAATARQLGRQGAHVVLAARNITACEHLLAEIRQAGGDGLVVPTDVTHEEEVQQLVERTLHTYGRLDAAFNNAGTLGPAGLVEHLSDSDYLHTFDVNVRSAFHCLRYQVPALRAAGGGSLVFTASMAGTVGFAQVAPYVASKHALIGLVRTAALELGRSSIRVNALCPGVVDTPMSDIGFGGMQGKLDYVATTPAGRWGEADEIAATACFLLSNASSFINGQPLLVDGAYTAQ